MGHGMTPIRCQFVAVCIRYPVDMRSTTCVGADVTFSLGSPQLLDYKGHRFLKRNYSSEPLKRDFNPSELNLEVLLKAGGFSLIDQVWKLFKALFVIDYTLERVILKH